MFKFGCAFVEEGLNFKYTNVYVFKVRSEGLLYYEECVLNLEKVFRFASSF